MMILVYVKLHGSVTQMRPLTMSIRIKIDKTTLNPSQFGIQTSLTVLGQELGLLTPVE
jgi:hypothetical protein